MRLYWLAPVLCGLLGLGLGYIIRCYLLRKLQGEFVKELLVSDKVTNAMRDSIGQKIVELTQDTRTIGQVTDGVIGEQQRTDAIEYGSRTLAGIITVELKNSQLASLLLAEIKSVLETRVKSGFLSSLVQGNTWDLVKDPLEKTIENYLDTRCQPLLQEKLQSRFMELMEKRMYEVGDLLLMRREQITKSMVDIYQNSVVDIISEIATQRILNQEYVKRQLKYPMIMTTGLGVLSGLLSVLLTLF